MQITSLTDPCDYDRILDEETPQAKRIASYLAGYNITRVLMLAAVLLIMSKLCVMLVSQLLA